MWRWGVERMSTLDAGFFFVEHRNVPMHVFRPAWTDDENFETFVASPFGRLPSRSS